MEAHSRRIIQAIGRGRGVNRDEGSPLTVFVCADVVLPMPLARLVQWDDVCPDVLSRMRARGAVLLGPSDAARVYPDLFPTVEAAKKALQGAKPALGFGDIPVGESMLGECPRTQLIKVCYRRAGPGQQHREAYVSLERLPTFQQWLEDSLGPLAHYAAVSSAAVLAPPAVVPLVSKAPAEPVATGRVKREAIILFFKSKLSLALAMEMKERGIVPLTTWKSMGGSRVQSPWSISAAA